MTDERGICITAVHGTHDPKAAWAQKDGRLHRTIALNLPALRHWHPFDWSAENAQHDRVAGGAKLVDEILSIEREQPGLLHFIIAHSHGGNVALYASQDPRLKGRLAGVITVGTPFFHAIQRNAYTLVRGTAQALLPAAALAVLLPFISAGHLLGSEAFHPVAKFVLALGGLLLALTAFVMLLVGLSRRNLPVRYAEAAKAVVQSLRGQGTPSCPFHCVWRADDEVQAGAVLIDALTGLLMFLRRPAVLLGLWLILTGCFWWCPVPVWETWPLNYVAASFEGALFVELLQAMLSGALAVIALSIVFDLSYWALLKVALRRGYGLQDLPVLAAPYVRIFAGLTPMQAKNVSFYELNRPPYAVRNHSLDDDPQFIECVLTILADTLEDPLPAQLKGTAPI